METGCQKTEAEPCVTDTDMVLGDQTDLVLSNETVLVLDEPRDGTETSKQLDGTIRDGGCSRAETRIGTGSVSL